MPPVAFPSRNGRTSQPPLVVAVIPARYQSTRLPAKPLADIAGQPMIEHVYRRAAAATGVDHVVVATDDARIAAVVEGFGGLVRMTAASHSTGTDRVAELARDLDCDVMVNVQGDLPLIDPRMIEEVIAPFSTDDGVQMTTLRRVMTDAADDHNPHVVKVVVDVNGDALYFSRSPLPYQRAAAVTRFTHIGLYAYRRDFLLTFAGLPRTPLEQSESLEQLRALEHGFRIRTVETQCESIEVDTPEDLERVRRHLTDGFNWKSTANYQVRPAVLREGHTSRMVARA